LAYCDSAGRVYFDEASAPLADGGFVRAPLAEELIPAPPGTVTALLPGRTPLLNKAGGGSRPAGRRTALSALLPAGYTRLLVPAYRTRPGAPTLPLFGYAFACCVDDELYVAAMRTDESEDWQPRYFAEGAVRPRLRLLHGAERLSRTRRSCAAALAFVQRALSRLHFRTGTRSRHPLTADPHRLRCLG
jgi:hypothetical protein